MNKNKGSASDYRRQDGFTLIELLVVIAIIGILSSVILTSVNSSRVKARTNAALSTMRSLMPVFDDCLSVGISLPTETQNGGTTAVCSLYPTNTYLKLPAGWSWCDGVSGGTCGTVIPHLSSSTTSSFSILAKNVTDKKAITCANTTGKCTISILP